MRQEEVWDHEAARTYDTPGEGMFAPEVLGPTTDRLAELAGDGRVLEFAIGTGRVAIPLAELGVPVTGIELSAPMIEHLRTKVDAFAIPVIAGDMTTSRAPGAYSLVFLVYNAISCLLSEQVACFRNAARHLLPGGRFVLENGVPGLRSLPPGQSAIVWKSEPGYIGLDTYDVLHQHLVSHHVRIGWQAGTRIAQPAPLHLALRTRPDGPAGRVRAAGTICGLGRDRVQRRIHLPRLGLPPLSRVLDHMIRTS